VPTFLAAHRPTWSVVRWINIDGLTDLDLIRAFAEKYQLHPLAIEDVLHTTQHPKVETYPAEADHHARLFIVGRMLQLDKEHLRSEQLSIFIGHNTILTFQESPGDIWDPLRERIMRTGSRVRGEGASFLLYSLLDALVDHCFPILDCFCTRLEELEDSLSNRSQYQFLGEIHEIRREMLLLRRQIWPMREVVQAILRDPHDCVSDETRLYLRDVYDHLVQVLDLLETYRELANGLGEMYNSMVANRTNDVMKVLTMTSTIFIPVSFVAGVFGMNFDSLPGQHDAWAFWIFCLICGGIIGTMAAVFRVKGWF
jgi:magnesium transporter